MVLFYQILLFVVIFTYLLANDCLDADLPWPSISIGFSGSIEVDNLKN